MQAGFSLLELMIVVAIVGILASIGIPAYQSMISNNNATAEINTLLGDLNRARSEAIKQGLSVQLCTANTNLTPPFVCSNSTNWANGWIVCSVSGCTSASNSGLISVQKPFTSGNALASSASGNYLLASSVNFNLFGFSLNQTAITDTPTMGKPTTLCISGLGNLQIVTGTVTACP